MNRKKMRELLAFQRMYIGYIYRFWDNIKKIGKNNITATILETKLKILHSNWERVDNDNAALMEGIESTDYYQKGEHICLHYDGYSNPRAY